MPQICGGLVECLRYTLQNPFDAVGLAKFIFDPFTIIVRVAQALALSLFGNPLF